MPKEYRKKPVKQQDIAKRRINFLFRIAKESFKKNPKTAEKCVKLATRVAMKHKIRLDSNFKKQFCKHCHNFLVPGANLRVRIHKHRVVYYCSNCKQYMRHPIK